MRNGLASTCASNGDSVLIELLWTCACWGTPRSEVSYNISTVSARYGDWECEGGDALSEEEVGDCEEEGVDVELHCWMFKCCD